jgi:arylformamidase
MHHQETQRMETYDVSVTISKDLVMPIGAPQPVLAPIMLVEEGYPYSIFMLSFIDHCGTHVDAPYHFEANGAKTDELPLDVLIGRARVVEVPSERAVEREDLERVDLQGVERLLLKTRNSSMLQSKDFRKDAVYLSPGAADLLVERGVKLVGIDYWSVEAFGSQDYLTHHTLLRNGIVIVELMDLSEIVPGDYELICLPLKLKGCGGAPARVLLRELS